MTQPQPETIALFYKNDSSDKEYHVHLKSSADLWIVEIQYGRRGSALRSSLKTKDPIPYEKAKAAYDKIVRDQLRDGYTPTELGVTYQDTPLKDNFTGILPQLLNSVDEQSFEDYLSDPQWMLQEKFDGERLMVKKEGHVVSANNRKGFSVAIPHSIEQAILNLPCEQCIVDGEWLGGHYAVFDLIEHNGVDLRSVDAKKRKEKLDTLLVSAPHPALLDVITAYTEDDKRSLHDRVKAGFGEGVVAKRIDSLYTVGRPNSLGDQIKRKFVESATVFITGIHPTKRSASMAVLPEGAEPTLSALVEVGSVTIPENYPLPTKGDVCECLYLYAYKGGSLFQPVFKGKRNDQDLSDCKIEQLKYKVDGPVTVKKAKL